MTRSEIVRELQAVRDLLLQHRHEKDVDEADKIAKQTMERVAEDREEKGEYK